MQGSGTIIGLRTTRSSLHPRFVLADALASSRTQVTIGVPPSEAPLNTRYESASPRGRVFRPGLSHSAADLRHRHRFSAGHPDCRRRRCVIGAARTDRRGGRTSFTACWRSNCEVRRGSKGASQNSTSGSLPPVPNAVHAPWRTGLDGRPRRARRRCRERVRGLAHRTAVQRIRVWTPVRRARRVGSRPRRATRSTVRMPR